MTEEEWRKLWEVSEGVPESKLGAIFAHLHAWHRLLLGWIKQAESGMPNLPAKGFNWRQTRELNAKLDLEFRDVNFQSIVRRLKLSHNRVMKMVEGLSESEFSKPSYFEWTGKLPLSSYIGPNTASHYRWAIKKIKKLK